jgi:hypothetical protein
MLTNRKRILIVGGVAGVPPVPQGPAGFKISRALFAKAAAELQNFAGFTQNFFSRIASDPLHGRIPGGNAPRCIHGKDTVGHGINNLIYKICVPDFMAFRLRGGRHQTHGSRRQHDGNDHQKACPDAD